LTAFDFADYMEERRRWVDESLDRCLPPASPYPSPVHGATRCTVFGGGKRSRPILTLAAAAEAKEAISPLPESRTHPLEAIAEHIIQRRR
jgi:geranylgeranyl pyrophosphate synthase